MTDPDADPRIPAPVAAPRLPEFDYERLDGRERIGRGGDADVYLSMMTHDGERYKVAVKEPRFEGTIHQRLVEEFRSEAETWCALDEHPNVVSVHSWDVTPVPWIALEYADGGTLDRRIGAADPAEALWLGGRIAEGIRHGHRRGVAHLDVTPSNVLLCETGPRTWDYPKVSDWGLAEHLIAHSGRVGGFSPQYAAPEQFDAERFGDPDDYTDIYQLGTVVYALLTGSPPFDMPPANVREGVMYDRPEPPSAVDPELPPAVDDVVLRAMATEKTDRYETVVGFRKDLDRLFADFGDGSDGASGSTWGSRPASAAADADADSNGGTSESTLSTRRAALGVLGAGVVGLGGWWASSVGDDRSESTAAPASGEGTGVGGAATPTARETAVASDSDVVATDRLVSRWPLRSDLRDTAGTSPAEVRRGEVQFGQFDGRAATAFDGSVGAILTNAAWSNSQLSLMAPGTDPGTITTWVYFDRPSGGRISDDSVASHQLFRKDAEYAMWARPANGEAVELGFAVFGQSGGGQYRSADRTTDELVVSTREWHHIAFVVDPGTSLTAYVDGTRRFHDDGMDATSPTVDNYWAKETIGGWYGDDTPAWYDLLVGKLADLRIYGAGLSDDQVERLHANTS